MRAAFITGGSSGIGLALAGRLAARGHPIALFARDAGKLDAAALELRRAHPALVVSAHAVDVSKLDAATGAFRRAVDELGAPEWAIACAGIAEPGLFLDQPLSTMIEQMETNFGGSLAFSHAVAPAMAAQGSGHLVFVSSGAAFAGILGYAGYGASKFAVRGLAETLRVELAGKGIEVTLACPPDTDTPQLAYEAARKPDATREITASGGVWSADAVAKAILRGADAGRFLVAPGWQMTALGHLHSLIAPGFRLWQRRIARKHEGGA